MSGRSSPAHMGGFITEVDEQKRQQPLQSTLTDEERARAARLKLRNALQGGRAEIALEVLDGEYRATLKQADLCEDGRLPLHVALDLKPDALGVTANSAPISILGKLYPKAAKTGDPTRDKALPLHVALEMGHEDVVVWCAAPHLPRPPCHAACPAGQLDGRCRGWLVLIALVIYLTLSRAQGLAIALPARCGGGVAAVRQATARRRPRALPRIQRWHRGGTHWRSPEGTRGALLPRPACSDKCSHRARPRPRLWCVRWSLSLSGVRLARAVPVARAVHAQ